MNLLKNAHLNVLPGATESTLCVQARLFTPALQKQQSARRLSDFFFFHFSFPFFYLVSISNQDCESIRLANRHNHTSHPAALMWDRALSSLFILPLPHSQLFRRGGGIDESAANIVRIRAEEESERPRGRGGGGLELQTVKHTVV